MKRKRRTKKNGGYGTLFVVDLQRAFDAPPDLINRIRRYAARFHCRVFTRFENLPGSLFRRELKQKCCGPESPDTELLVAPRKGDLVFAKHGYGLDPEDIRKLKRRGIRRVTVCGIDTDACVLGVMFSLFDAGIECHAKEDMCWSSTSARLHKAGMTIIAQQFPTPR